MECVWSVYDVWSVRMVCVEDMQRVWWGARNSRVKKENLGETDAHFPPTTEAADKGITIVFCEAHRIHHFEQLRFELYGKRASTIKKLVSHWGWDTNTRTWQFEKATLQYYAK